MKIFRRDTSEDPEEEPTPKSAENDDLSSLVDWYLNPSGQAPGSNVEPQPLAHEPAEVTEPSPIPSGSVPPPPPPQTSFDGLPQAAPIDSLPVKFENPPLHDSLSDLKERARHSITTRIGSLVGEGIDDDRLESMVLEGLADVLEEEDVTQYTETQLDQLGEELVNDILKHGPIEPLLEDPLVSEVMVNGPDMVFVERGGRLFETSTKFDSEAQVRRVIDRIVSRIGRRIDEASPMVDARLPDGSRVNAIIPPLAVDGSSLTIRKFSAKALTEHDLVGYGTLSWESVGLLRAFVSGRLNMVISGGTGSGKTTMLNVCSNFIPEGERVVTIEDSVELQLAQRHIVRLESRPANVEGSGEVAIRDLVKNSLRMRPDRIVVGECRGGEALDMLQAMNTGHDGSLTTLHANSPRDAISRLETLVLMAGMDLPVRAIREQIASAVDVIVQLNRLRDGSRRVTHITEVTGMEGDKLTLSDIFLLEMGGLDENGKLIAELKPTGIRPKAAEKLSEHGIELRGSLFGDPLEGLV